MSIECDSLILGGNELKTVVCTAHGLRNRFLGQNPKAVWTNGIRP